MIKKIGYIVAGIGSVVVPFISFAQSIPDFNSLNASSTNYAGAFLQQMWALMFTILSIIFPYLVSLLVLSTLLALGWYVIHRIRTRGH